MKVTPFRRFYGTIANFREYRVIELPFVGDFLTRRSYFTEFYALFGEGTKTNNRDDQAPIDPKFRNLVERGVCRWRARPIRSRSYELLVSRFIHLNA